MTTYNTALVKGGGNTFHKEVWKMNLKVNPANGWNDPQLFFSASISSSHPHLTLIQYNIKFLHIPGLLSFICKIFAIVFK